MSFQGRSGGGFGGPREMFDAVCAECGKETQVPFRPTGDRPVYCRDCFQKQGGGRGRGGGGGGGGGRGFGGPREMFDVVCSDCGKETQVPFKPTEGRPVFCRDCFSKHRSAGTR